MTTQAINLGLEANPGFACTVCGERDTVSPFDRRRGPADVVFDLWVCRTCLVILNGPHLASAQAAPSANLDAQGNGSEAYFAAIAQDGAGLRTLAEARQGFLRHLLDLCPDLARGAFLDYGAGQAAVAAAAAVHFGMAYAWDLKPGTMQACYPHYDHKDRIRIVADLDEIVEPLDAIMLIHVVEHLPDITSTLRMLTQRLAPGGAILYQVPMVKNEYLCHTHFTFLSLPSAIALGSRLQLTITDCRVDIEHDFLTVTMRKS